jgi:hypothetical protein
MKVLSMRGKTVDMARLAAENANKIAVGNASMNAKGDVIGPGGNVVRSREQIVRDYHATNPKAVKQIALRNIKSEVFVSPAEALAVADKPKSKRKIADAS